MFRLRTLLALCLLPTLLPAADDPFRLPEKFVGDLGSYRSPLKFDDGTAVKAADWLIVKASCFADGIRGSDSMAEELGVPPLAIRRRRTYRRTAQYDAF